VSEDEDPGLGWILMQTPALWHWALIGEKRMMGVNSKKKIAKTTYYPISTRCQSAGVYMRIQPYISMA